MIIVVANQRQSKIVREILREMRENGSDFYKIRTIDLEKMRGETQRHRGTERDRERGE